MGKFVVIGLGNFGYYLAKSLYDDGKEVIGVDRVKERVQRLQESCSYAMVGDVTDKHILESICIEKDDVVIVSLGDNISASVLVTLHLKDLDIHNIYQVLQDLGNALSFRTKQSPYMGLSVCLNNVLQVRRELNNHAFPGKNIPVL